MQFRASRFSTGRVVGSNPTVPTLKQNPPLGGFCHLCALPIYYTALKLIASIMDTLAMILNQGCGSTIQNIMDSLENTMIGQLFTQNLSKTRSKQSTEKWNGKTGKTNQEYNA